MIKRIIYTVLGIMMIFPCMVHAQEMRIANQSSPVELKLPRSLKKAVQKIQYDLLGNEKGTIRIEMVGKNCLHIQFTFSPDKTVKQDDWQVVISMCSALRH